MLSNKQNMAKKQISNFNKSRLYYPTTIFFFLLMVSLVAIGGLFLNMFDSEPDKIALAAPSEPTCQSLGSNPTWNPYPINNQTPSPLFTPGNCTGMPLLSFFPIDTANGNPREKTIIEDEDFSIQLYYNNGAEPGSSNIQNPNLKVEVTQENNTRYRISAILSGGNVSTVTSANKGGDLFVNVPNGTKLNIVGDNTLHYIDAMERKFESDTTGRTPYDVIPDNSSSNNTSNPIYSRFDGVQLGSTNGFIIKPNGLESRFLGYGYVLSQIRANVDVAAPENNPPQIPGQEITIIRGDSGSFQPLNPTDPENDIPISLDLTKVLDFCTITGTPDNTGGGQIITCQTDQNTPVRSEFNITPTDSKGLVGTPGKFIVNVIDPDLQLTKTCFALGTKTPCNQAKLNPGDDITYEITASNNSTTPLRNLVIEDDYPEDKITDIRNISDLGVINLDTNKIIWGSLGNLAPSNSKTVSFNATINPTVSLTDSIENISVAAGEGVDPKQAKYVFALQSPDIKAEKLCFKFDTNIPCDSAKLLPGEKIAYKIIIRNAGSGIAKNVKVVDDYDETKLISIADINPKAELNTQTGVITWELGDFDPDQVKELTYSATISNNLPSGTKIRNLATVSGSNFQDIRLSTEFVINIIITSQATPRTGGGLAVGLVLIAAIIAGGGYWYYRQNKKLSTSFVPSRKSQEESKSNKKDPRKFKKH